MIKYFWYDLIDNNDLDRHLPKIIVDNNKCWNWSACHNSDGYGWCGLAKDGIKKMFAVHRLLFELYNSNIPEGLVLDHLCRNRKCCNPDHLEIVTNKENILRGISPSAINKLKSICPQGHELKGNNLYIDKSSGARRCLICRRKQISKSKRKHNNARK